MSIVGLGLDLAKIDRDRPKKGSNKEWRHPHDPDARITKMKDGRTHLAHKAEHVVDMSSGAVVAVNLHDNSISADQFPSDEWLLLAESLVAQGKYRLALRAVFLSILAHLGRSDRVTIAPYKANRDYIADLQRRTHDRPDIINLFASAVVTVECHWYGSELTSFETVTHMRSISKQLTNDASHAEAQL